MTKFRLEIREPEVIPSPEEEERVLALWLTRDRHEGVYLTAEGPGKSGSPIKQVLLTVRPDGTVSVSKHFLPGLHQIR